MQTFVPNKHSKTRGVTLAEQRGQKISDGQIGIEVEVEGKRLPCVGMHVGDCKESVYKGFQKFWQYLPDGSLRGEENGEYVLRAPIKFDSVPDALDALWDTFKDCKSKLDDSNRTSVHIHLNCQKFHTNRLTSLLALYMIFEEVLTAWCGDHRVGNLFCLRAKDAPGMLHSIKNLIRNDFSGSIHDGLHYSGMNVHALSKHGSLEFRSMRGTQDADTIMQWVRVLRRLYELSADFKDPREICYLFSGEGPANFFNTILGDCSDFIRSGVSFSEQEIRESMYEGIRLAQDICYCRDWSAFEEVNLKKDPFGRSQKKVLSNLIHYDMETDPYVEPYDTVLNHPTAPTISLGPPPPVPYLSMNSTTGLLNSLSTSPQTVSETWDQVPNPASETPLTHANPFATVPPILTQYQNDVYKADFAAWEMEEPDDGTIEWIQWYDSKPKPEHYVDLVPEDHPDGDF